MNALSAAYPWIKLPLVVSAPMLGAATPKLAANVSVASGIGFLAGGTSPKALDGMLSEVREVLSHKRSDQNLSVQGVLPVGVGFQLFGCDREPLVEIIAQHVPSAVWLFAPKEDADLTVWSESIRTVTGGRTQIWLQVGGVAEMMRGVKSSKPDVLIMQGADAGGHGQDKSASIISLVPEALDALRTAGHGNIPVLAAGGIAEGRGFAAALSLGAHGAVFGTRFLVAEESGIARGWKTEILRSHDGGVSTLRSTLCDRLKETKGWPSWYDGRAIKNQGHVDEEGGLSDADNVRLYQQEAKLGDGAWGLHGRMVAYAGTGVGLITREQSAGSIVDELRTDARLAVKELNSVFAGNDD